MASYTEIWIEACRQGWSGASWVCRPWTGIWDSGEV